MTSTTTNDNNDTKYSLKKMSDTYIKHCMYFHHKDEYIPIYRSEEFFKSLAECNNILDAKIELKQAQLKHYIDTKNTDYSFKDLRNKVNKQIRKNRHTTNTLNVYKNKCASSKVDKYLCEKVAKLIDKYLLSDDEDNVLLTCINEFSHLNVLAGYEIANVKYDKSFSARTIRTPYTDMQMKQNKLDLFAEVLDGLQAGKEYKNQENLDNLDDPEKLYEFALNNDMTLLVNNPAETHSYVRYVICSELVRSIKTMITEYKYTTYNRGETLNEDFMYGVWAGIYEHLSNKILKVLNKYINFSDDLSLQLKALSPELYDLSRVLYAENKMLTTIKIVVDDLTEEKILDQDAWDYCEKYNWINKFDITKDIEYYERAERIIEKYNYDTDDESDLLELDNKLWDPANINYIDDYEHSILCAQDSVNHVCDEILLNLLEFNDKLNKNNFKFDSCDTDEEYFVQFVFEFEESIGSEISQEMIRMCQNGKEKEEVSKYVECNPVSILINILNILELCLQYEDFHNELELKESIYRPLRRFVDKYDNYPEKSDAFIDCVYEKNYQEPN